MNPNPATKNKFMKKKISKKIFMGAVAILLIGAIAAVGFRYLKPKSTASQANRQLARVQKGELVQLVSGSGPISSSDKYDVTPNVSGTLTKIYYKDGDKIKAGALLFEIDDSDARLKIKQLENSIQQARLSQEYDLKDLQSNKVVAAIDGEVASLQVKAGDSLNQNGTVLTITDKSKLKLLVSFNNTYRSKLTIGQQVTVNAFNTTTEDLYTVNGKISQISSPSYKTSDGAEVYNVEVTIDNSSNLKEGMVGNVELNIDGTDIKSKDSGTLSYAQTVTAKTSAGGTVSKIYVTEGQNVKKGDILAELDNEDLQLSTQTSELKLQDLEIQLQIAEENLDDYKLYSPIDGTFTLNDVQQGNSIKQGDILGSVANYDTMEFSIDVDELDIAKIQVGQTADVTIDALTETNDKPLKGTVKEIAIEGTSSDGVSTYPVTILLEKDEALKGGMNANAEIVVNKKTDVLYVPIDAVQKKNGKSYVSVAAATQTTPAASDSSGKGTSGTTMKEVTTGISNDQYIEIVSGLNEGDTVTVTSSSSATSSTQNQQGMGMPPMDGGGGPPAGGGQQNGSNNRRSN